MPLSRPLLLLGAGGLCAAVAAAGLPGARAVPSPAPSSRTVVAAPVCSPGYVVEHETDLASFADGATSSCVPALRPETYRDLASANGQQDSKAQAPFGVKPDAYAAGSAQAAALSGKGYAVAGSWQPLGTTPLIANGAPYGEVNQQGFVNLAGRIQDFAYVPGQTGHWFAAVANGGIQETSDAGKTWRPISDTLPTQITGAVAYDSGRVLVGTGDPAFGGNSLSGLGAFYSDDDGASWTKASGVPAGALSFRLAIDPTNASTVYLASSQGLFRSTDKGASYSNVVLPTTCTSRADRNCFFANIVTDVAVQAAGGPGKTKGGAVLAAVGWRAGQKLNTAGKPQAPQNGLYTSATGAPGSFTFVSPGGSGVPNVTTTGFPDTRYVGRTALGVANGPTQDHNYVYALVEDAVKFNGGACVLDIPDGSPSAAPCAGGTVLNGVYGSADFGMTWTKLADPEALKSPAGQSALIGAGSSSYNPGIQSWYNEWITPDPGAALTDPAGAPMHLAFGLEEVWQNTTTDSAGSSGLSPIVISPAGLPVQTSQTTQFQVVGRYYGGNSCYGLRATTPAPCPTNVQHQGSTSTHPDQHAGLFVPDADGKGVTLLVGNDGGAYAQHTAGSDIATQAGWGDGAQGTGTGVMHTLLPYSAVMAKDGTVYAGLQDNGELKINPDGTQFETYGGDGFFSAVDPDNSKTAYEEYVGGAVSVTTDGGSTWSSIDPGLTAPLFATPFVMDPTNAEHLLIAGRDVYETTAGPKTNQSSDGISTDPATAWTKVYDLGTRLKPGDASAAADTSDPNNASANNQESAIDVYGANAYVGFCGACDIVTGTRPFHSGIATNVGGARPAKPLTGDGWHIAAAAGLPQRYIQGITVDHRDPRTVYAAVGGYGRRWIPPGALNDDTSKVGTGHLFVSHDAGEHFTDISGNLPDLPANAVLVHGSDLVVATDNGVYTTPVAHPGAFSALAPGLPTAPVLSLQESPRSANEIVAASFGRGVYDLVLGGGTAGLYHPLTPSRILDTRTAKTPLAAASDLALTVTGKGGVPATGVSAVVLGVVVAQPAVSGDLEVYPAGDKPANRTSNLNWSPGKTVANAVTVAVGQGGQVGLSVNTGSVSTAVDVLGWYGDTTDTSGSRYTALTPTRVLDTGSGTGRLAAGADRRLLLRGRAGVPDRTDVSAVVLNLTVEGTPSTADIQVYPTGARPAVRTSNTNLNKGQTAAVLVDATLGSDGSVQLSLSRSSARVVVDVVGYYSGQGGRFVPMAPVRILDRAPVGAGHDVAQTITGKGGVPAGATGVVVNVTGLGATRPLDLQVYPSGRKPPVRTSVLNLRPGQAVPNLDVATLENGSLNLSVSTGTAKVILDAVGYFTAS